ncbi:hypothetical protein GOV13_02590 [Candidatus Pacearchaeota archaeon]|nr:hypothetical protein [Candidatus Pacearchaeota archaeon]
MVFEICQQIIEGNSSAIIDCPITQAMTSGAMGGLVALGTMFVSLFGVLLYVYHSWTWMVIAQKLKYKTPWLAWIPFASTAMRLQLGKFHWAWTFLWLIPIFGWIAILVLLIISYWRVFEKRKYPGWFSLSLIIPKIGGVLYLVVIGFVAWKDRKKRLTL